MKKIIPVLVLLTMITGNRTTAQPTIVTSQGTFKLTPPDECINSNCLNGVAVTAALAGKALEADIAKANNEAASLNSDLKSLNTEYEASKTSYHTAKAPYDVKLDGYMTDKQSYIRDVTMHNTDVAASDAKKPEDRSAAEVSRLNQNKTALDVRYTALENRRMDLENDRTILLQMWKSLEAKKGALTGKRIQVQGLSDKIGNALEQLLLCEQFGKKALEVSTKKGWGSYKTVNDFFGTLKIIPSKELLNRSLEQMKAWSNKVWD